MHEFENQSRGWDSMEGHVLAYLQRNWRPDSWADADLPGLGTSPTDLQGIASAFAEAALFIVRRGDIAPALLLSGQTPATAREAGRVRSAGSGSTAW